MLVIKLWLAQKKLSLPEFYHFFVIINLGRNYNWAAAHKKTSFHRTSGQTIPRRNRTFDLRCKRWFFFLLISILIFELWLYPCVRTFQGILGCCCRCHKRLQTSEPVTFPTFFVSLQPLAGSALKRKRRKNGLHGLKRFQIGEKRVSDGLVVPIRSIADNFFHPSPLFCPPA